MMKIIHMIIEDMLTNNKENEPHLDSNPTVSEYNHGYHDGYHDALVDVLNNLNIPNNHEIINH